MSSGAALLAFKRATIRYGKSKMRAWSKSGHPCQPARWPHVECRLVWPRSGPPKHRVHSLNVANCSVVARLPVRLGKLMMAEEVNLEGNRIVGNIPPKWGKRLYFRRLKRLVLRNNRLTGTLPNNWNTRSGWPRLQMLDLSGNKLRGGLPSTWLGGRKPFRRLNYLDLSENQLGLQADGIPYLSSEAPDGWCTGGRNDFDSWCPTASNFQPRKSKMPNLVSLDISNNLLQGALPSKWGYMFPSLQFLLIHSNKLYSSSEGVAEALPASWTRQIVPTTFRSLTMLMLHPGNGFICALPAPVQQGILFEQTQRDAEFAIVDKHYEQYDSSGPWLCPGPAVPLPATDPGVNMVNFGSTTNNVILKWQAPLPNPQDSIFGYKVYLWLSDPDQGIIPGWLGKFFRTYDASLPSEMSVMGGLCILSTGILADGVDHSKGEYSMAVEVVYTDGQVSDALIATGLAT